MATNPTHINFAENNLGHQVGVIQGPVQYNGQVQLFYQSHKPLTNSDLIQALQCPNADAAKNRLKESKDKLRREAFEWVFRDENYLQWQDGDEVGLLWVKGGAGKGKTMMSLGILDELAQKVSSENVARESSFVMVYFFCQDDDDKYNTIEATLKGLIEQLVLQHPQVGEVLRRRWDPVQACFTEDVTSWRTIWAIWLEMLQYLARTRVYIVVDALDSCQGQEDGVSDFLHRIVRAGLDRRSRIKWLFITRPMDSATQQLLHDADQLQINLDTTLNMDRIADGVRTYVTFKTEELSRRFRYGSELKDQAVTELTDKAEGTFQWVSLVCKSLEGVKRQDVLATIRESPPGLDALYRRIFDQLLQGDTALVKDCLRLLKAMMLVQRPLHVSELDSVIGEVSDETTVEALLDRCASFLRRRSKGTIVEFIHKTARDFFDGTGRALLDMYESFGHGEIVLNCLSYLSSHLKTNFVGLPRPNSTRKDIEHSVDPQKSENLLLSVRYAATYWFQHVNAAVETTQIKNALAEGGAAALFLETKLLEWLECLSLLEQLPGCVKAFGTLSKVVGSQSDSFVSSFSQDAIRFVRQNYHILEIWPLQIYSSGIIFSPQSSPVRQANIDKLPAWLRRLRPTTETWTPLIQTLQGHSQEITSISFSLGSQQIASSSEDKAIKLWNVSTGELQGTLNHTEGLTALAASPEGEIASGSTNGTVKLWNRFGEIQWAPKAHENLVTSIAFSPDGSQLLTGSRDKTVQLRDAKTGDLQATLDHPDHVRAVAFSPDGNLMASGSSDHIIRLWTRSGDLQQMLRGHEDWVRAIAFSPDSEYLASGSDDGAVRLWHKTGEVQSTLKGHLGSVRAVAFLPDSEQIASGSEDKTIKIWNKKGEAEKTFTGHADGVRSIAISPDGKQMVSGSADSTIKLWDPKISHQQHSSTDHSGAVQQVVFSPDNKQIASRSQDGTVKMWSAKTGTLLTRKSQSEWVKAIAFSPDGKFFALGKDADIELINIQTSRTYGKLPGHKHGTSSMAFSSTSRQMATGSTHATIKLWDITTLKVQQVLKGHSGAVTAVAFSHDNRQLVSASTDNTIFLWDIIQSSKSLKLFGRNVGKAPVCQKLAISTSIADPINTLKVSPDGLNLNTNLGVISIQEALADLQVSTFQPSNKLSINIRDQWVYLATAAVLRFPADLEAVCFDVQGDQMAVGFRNGQVLSFDIDYRRLRADLDLDPKDDTAKQPTRELVYRPPRRSITA
ncbi:MAG: hypothetical protein Q9160_000688 [Pyrenula sp. 1 TL-2023]